MTPPLLFDLRGKRVFVAGHGGLAGSAIVRRLADEQCEILTMDRQNLIDAAIGHRALVEGDGSRRRHSRGWSCRWDLRKRQLSC